MKSFKKFLIEESMDENVPTEIYNNNGEQRPRLKGKRAAESIDQQYDILKKAESLPGEPLALKSSDVNPNRTSAADDYDYWKDAMVGKKGDAESDKLYDWMWRTARQKQYPWQDEKREEADKEEKSGNFGRALEYRRDRDILRPEPDESPVTVKEKPVPEDDTENEEIRKAMSGAKEEDIQRVIDQRKKDLEESIIGSFNNFMMEDVDPIVSAGIFGGGTAGMKKAVDATIDASPEKNNAGAVLGNLFNVMTTNIEGLKNVARYSGAGPVLEYEGAKAKNIPVVGKMISDIMTHPAFKNMVTTLGTRQRYPKEYAAAEKEFLRVYNNMMNDPSVSQSDFAKALAKAGGDPYGKFRAPPASEATANAAIRTLANTEDTMTPAQRKAAINKINPMLAAP